ncbi:hypothetical protein [Clostridium sp.]|uniref:hypothetical protein n=1 Tax=Clostridium sp. TaxID=1506 RepID=UPI002FC814DA
MAKPNIKVKLNYPETEDEMRKYEEIKVESFYKTLKGMLDKDGLKLLLNELKNENVI